MDFSYQLYSSRKFPPLGETLKMVAAAGYTQVEGYGALYESPDMVETLKAALDETGLTMPTAHFGLEFVQADPARAIAIARALGIRAVFAPFTADQDRDAAGWAQFGRDLSEAGKPLQDAGLAYGWHNHAFEFADLGGGQRPLDLILVDNDLLLELDVAWVQVGGADPLAWMANYADRVLSVHVKDIAPEGTCTDEDGWADVGHGTLDWAALLGAARQTRAEYFVMEHDNPSDHHRFATRSIAAARTY